MRGHLFITILLAAATIAQAQVHSRPSRARVATRDVYVLQGFAYGAHFNTETIVFSTDVMFYNKSVANRNITLLGISGGGPAGGALGESFTISPARSASLGRTVTWIPVTGSSLFVLRLDVPLDVEVEDVLLIGSQPDVLASPTAEYRKYGKVRLPLSNSLTPANEPQVHLESDLGDIPSHVNVAVYNAGDRLASAKIELRQHCDDRIIASQTALVPPNTVLQFGPFQAETASCAGVAVSRSIYTTVIVDQPSLTYVSTLANSGIPMTSIGTSGE
jgi:hypothetical protein